MIPLIFICITLVYVLLIGSFAYGLEKVKPFIFNDSPAKSTFSIIIPFRNEAANLPELLASLSSLEYPKHLYEILLVNDASEDKSLEIIDIHLSKNRQATNIQVIDNIRKTKSPKKDAISTAITISSKEWILTTDADCTVPKYWLAVFDHFIQQNSSEFIVAPVTYTNANSFFKRFQLLDFLSLQGATIGAFGIQKPFLSNGANLAYKKDFFERINGFTGNSDIASGDDIFMLEKALKQSKNKVQYIKNTHAIVHTKTQETVTGLISQRVRWASKTTAYKNAFAKIVGIIVLLMNATLLIALALCIVKTVSFKILMCLFLMKCSIDFLLLFKTARFFSQEHYLSSYIFSSFLYPFFSIYIAFISTFKKYKWKDRAFYK